MTRTDALEMIEASQTPGQPWNEFDLKDLATGKYVGQLIGIETEKGICWSIEEWRGGNRTGSILRIPPTNLVGALIEARQFLIR